MLCLRVFCHFWSHRVRSLFCPSRTTFANFGESGTTRTRSDFGCISTAYNLPTQGNKVESGYWPMHPWVAI